MFFVSNLFAWDEEIEKSMLISPDLENGKRIYQICATCHQETGWADGSDLSRKQKPGFFPQISGQHKNVIIKQLLDIRAGNRDNPMMYPFTLDKFLGGGDQGIADVSAYISQLPMSLNNNIGPGDNLELGKKLYKQHCTNCHGEYGEGSNKDFYPKIQGQHYNYLLRQFIWIRDGKRRNANEKMVQQISQFKYSEITAVVDYASRLKPKPQDKKPATSKQKETTESFSQTKKSSTDVQESLTDINKPSTQQENKE
ncbi:MAG: c-type cytochrome [Gammaproteobacteria bacterium]|nr:c-type cytochrome [Gammaproteobacteria bacterium]